jgi:predicted amidohydrolase
VLLSECALTGYVSPNGEFDLSVFAEPIDGPITAGLSQLAIDHGISLGASFVERLDDELFNAYVIHDPGGDRIVHYRKRHPWIPEAWATAGTEPLPRFEIGGMRCTLAVCFDVHFLAEESADELNWAEVLLFPSAWVNGDGPRDTRDRILPALARQFGLWIVNPNWGVSKPRVWGQGGSQIITPEGEIQAIAPRGLPPYRVEVSLS